tara:strand:- start:595 stop:819 length:225 start_codon:yes stop_codon:yes gene_type:complete
MARKEAKDYKWYHEGLAFAVVVYLINVFVLPWYNNKPFSWDGLLINIPASIIGGLVYGYIMKIFRERQEKKKQN